ncbi:putative UPF0551 protein C8orf38 like protein, mitochondrial [Glarea lozoyensis 74030]|uniref:Putative UPF0551 protein C8orf38 like protein, mitochondrial n=1 Tax=Glarea lozoyensis (strain ATCC 74030 / MF5533) TaxID=1104152 RepID=H0EFK1_GLAL7|nr:putative UPF0551 protein C8orf38 like protein, mitochondrial [Glarea lozoyensis 74030]
MSKERDCIAPILSTRDAYLAIRTLNIELARIPDLVSNPTVGALRMQFWRDSLTQTGVREEDIFRHGSEAPGLKDAIFKVATRANDHLITAREMMKNLQQGEDAGHAYEHEGDEGHNYAERIPSGQSQLDELERGFGVLMPAVSTRLWLESLEKYDFDVFKPELRSREWKLPFKAYWAYSRRTI